MPSGCDSSREAVKDIDPGLLASEPAMPWKDVAPLRDHLTHRYLDMR